MAVWRRRLTALAGAVGVVSLGIWRERDVRRSRGRLEDQLDARRDAEAKIRAQNEEIARLAAERGQLVAQVAEAEQRTRQRIAQTLHDDALQSLLAAHQELLEAAPGRAQVTRAHEVIGLAIDRVREAVGSLHPVTLEVGGFDQALGAVARRAGRRGGWEAEIELAPDAFGTTDELVLGVARELLDNCALHARATRVAVSLRRLGDEVVLEVSDDGVGIAPGRRREAIREGHVGLASIIQRVETAGGSFEFDPRADPGALARAKIPAV